MAIKVPKALVFRRKNESVSSDGVVAELKSQKSYKTNNH